MLLIGAGIRTFLAVTTDGTTDVDTFDRFARAVRTLGPFDIYGKDVASFPFNHAPLTPWLLIVMNRVVDAGVPFAVALRLGATMADLGTGILVFGLVRTRFGNGAALFAAGSILLNPLLIMTSGFHGNMEPFFILFLITAVFLTAHERHPVLAGICLGSAASIKLMPALLIPLFAAIHLRHARLRPFTAGVAASLTVIWLPPIVLNGGSLVRDVIGYGAIFGNAWGIQGLTALAGLSWSATLKRMMAGVAGLVGTVAGTIMILRRPHRQIESLLLAVVIALVVTPSLGVQYLAWPVALGALVDPRNTVLFSAVGASHLAATYTHWSRGFPWTFADATRGLDGVAFATGLGAWLVMILWAADLVRRLPRPNTGHP